MILHIDMDAYYASVEERDQPDLVGKPVIVGGAAESRGVVSAANYVARKYGVHSAMPMRTALRYCPRAVVLPVRMEHYAEISRQIRDVFHRYTPLVEPLSLDEAFLDVAGSKALFGPATEIGQRIKAEVLKETGLVASIGVAPNKFLAKIASDLKKPDAFVVVEPDRVAEFLDPLPVSRLWGVGKRAEEKLSGIGVKTIGQLRRTPLPTLKICFGEAVATHLLELSHGRDDRSVVPDRDAKSISHETTFPVDVSDFDVLRACLLELTEQVSRRVRRHNIFARTVHIKVRLSDFQTVTRAHSLSDPSNTTSDLWDAVSNHLMGRVDLHQPVRLLGVGVSSLSHTRERQRTLFDDTSERDTAIDTAADAIRDRFGNAALKRGTSIDKGGD